MTIIKLLQPTDFRTFKGWVSQGNINPVFVASMRIKNGKKHTLQDVYAKIYPFTQNDRSLFNEIVGYLVAHALKIPQPNHSYIALINTKDILANNHNHLSDDFISLLQSETHYPVFCTTKIDKSKTAFDFHGYTPSLITEMSKWQYLADTIALDNTIAHTDRHLNNILRTGKHTYYIIDNGRLASEDGTPWQSTTLDCQKEYSNQLLQFAEEHIRPQSWKTVKNKVMSVCNQHTQAIQDCLNELNYWIQALYNGQQFEYNAFTDFLIKRANDSEFYHARKLNLLI